MLTKNMKRYLMLLAAIGLVAVSSGGGSGTFASFNAEVANTGNYFQTGTLFLHDNGGTNTCTSEAAANNQNLASTNGCDTIFNVSNIQEGDSSTATLTLTNAGSIDASKLQFALGAACSQGKALIVKMTSINTATNTVTVPSLPNKLFAGTVLTLDNGTDPAEDITVAADAPASGSSTTFTYSGADPTATYGAGTRIEWGKQFGTQTDLCSTIQVYVESDSSLGGAADYCLFGAAVQAGACSFGSGATIADLGTDPSVNSFTNTQLGGSSAMPAGTSRYLKIGWKLPASSLGAGAAGNADQNNSANFDLRWHIEQ